MNFLNALYRKNNFGQPCFWEINVVDNFTLEIKYGILGKTITTERIKVKDKAHKACQSKINAKRKTGYKYLNEIKDNVTLPVKEELYNYLKTYLPDNRTTADGTLLPMLAKVYDNSNNKLFKNVSSYFGQWKINGLRCFVSAYRNYEDIFRPIRLRFQSREGIYWNSLLYLEDYILSIIPDQLLGLMIEEHYILDGELYFPGASINEIDHYVKDGNCKENRLLQYWVYDIAIEDMPQHSRLEVLYKYLNPYNKYFYDKDEHLSNTQQLLILPNVTVTDGNRATEYRNRFIDLGFEGLILRNPDAIYQYGKRNQSMIKYKKSTDGKFLIVDIKPEGIKRPDIPLFICKNDINDAQFECHVGGALDYQKQCLINKDNYIGKYMYVKYGERSGINNLPFHIKQTYII